MKFFSLMIAATAFVSGICGASEIMTPDGTPPLSSIAMKGQRPAKLDVVSGFGKDIPLMEAVKLIAPKDVVPVFDDTISTENPKVTWRGGESWAETLNQIFKQSRVSGVMNFDTMRLYVVSAKATTPTAAPVIAAMEIVGIQQNADTVTITLANPVSEIYIVDRIQQKDVIVNWVAANAFSFPVSIAEKIRITTSKGVSNIVRTDGRWVIDGA